MSTTGRNITLPIYVDVDGQRTSFENLVLRKSVVDSVVMSLSDNITGDVYYKDNNLQVSLHEYIIYKDVKYVLVSPPTIVREGMVSDNSDLRGMTKYSFVFYHPMYQLSNLPFTDVAVSANEIRYKSEDKKFSWIGNLRDFVRKINKNLENTMWVVTISSRVPQDIENKLSDVLTFDNSTIADALKQIYETWEIPFIVDALEEGEESYDIGKRFSILCGLPSNEIYASESDREQDIPFVFRFGKGVGLKNNSATPRNNKIITRIAGYGSENNIPYGYPQIVWTGNQSWEYTIENDPNNSHSYRIYDGIVGGALVKLIKHPFTRTHLMPSIYVERVNKKVNPYAQGYDPDIELVDYYDANDSSIYPNTIVSGAPSYEQHEFSDIKPELGEQYILNARPINNDESYAPAWDDTMDGEGNYTQSYFKVRLPILNFDLYASAAITQEMQINMRSGACIGCTFPVQVDWEDYKLNFYDSDGNFAPQGSQRNFTKYPDSSQGQIEIILQKEYQTFGVIMPNVYQVPKNGDQFVVLGISLPLSYITDAQERLDDSMKDFMLENNVHYFDYPLKFDEKFLYDHTNILAQIRNNSIIRFEFAETELMLYVKHITIKYGEGVLPKYDITLTDDVEVVLNQIGQTQAEIGRINTLISALRQNYDKSVWGEIAKKLSKVDNDTAQGKITFEQGLQSNDDAKFGNFLEGATGAAVYQDEYGNWYMEADFIRARKKLTAKEIQIEEVSHVGGQIMLTAAEMVCDYVEEHENYYRCFFLAKDDDGKTIHNKWKIGDQATMQSFDVVQWKDGDTHPIEDGLRNRYYWRLVIGTDLETTASDFNNDFNGDFGYGGMLPNGMDVEEVHWIDLSKRTGEYLPNSDAPMEGDNIVQLGYQGNDVDRQNAIVLAGAGSGSPYIDEYEGINTFSLEGTVKTRIKPGDNRFTGLVQMRADSTINGENILGKFDKVGDDIEKAVNGLTTGNENLLRNTGFTGDFTSMDVLASQSVNNSTPIYSDPLQYWDYNNAQVATEVVSASGFAADLSDGYIQQQVTKDLTLGQTYCLSFRGRGVGSVATLSLGGVSESIVLDGTVRRYTRKIVVVDTSKKAFRLSARNAHVMEIMVTEGNIPNTDWIPSPLDNDKTLAYYQNLVYLANAIANASTSILGGLILTQMIRVGNYRDGEMTEETGGMSGLYTSNNSPFLWGGGNMEQAFYTINKYLEDPSYQATDEEVAQMAKFVVTHGGRAILNDIILRGYVYAKGGYFKGEINAESGVFKNVHSPDNMFALDEDGRMSCKDAVISGSIYNPMFILNERNWNDYVTEYQGRYLIPLIQTGLNVQINYAAPSIGGTPYAYIMLPREERFIGARVNVINNTQAVMAMWLGYEQSYATVNGQSFGAFICYWYDDVNIAWMKIN